MKQQFPAKSVVYHLTIFNHKHGHQVNSFLTVWSKEIVLIELILRAFIKKNVILELFRTQMQFKK